jgi:hypothetical protein
MVQILLSLSLHFYAQEDFKMKKILILAALTTMISGKLLSQNLVEKGVNRVEKGVDRTGIQFTVIRAISDEYVTDGSAKGGYFWIHSGDGYASDALTLNKVSMPSLDKILIETTVEIQVKEVTGYDELTLTCQKAEVEVSPFLSAAAMGTKDPNIVRSFLEVLDKTVVCGKSKSWTYNYSTGMLTNSKKDFSIETDYRFHSEKSGS